MIRGMMWLLAIQCVLLAGCQNEKPKEASNDQSFDGTWTIVNSTILGEPRPDTLMSNPKALDFVFQGDQVNCLGQQCVYRVDPTRVPMTIDIAPAAGGLAYMGIVRWQDGQLNLCVAAQGQPRPEKFDELESSITKTILMLRRQ